MNVDAELKLKQLRLITCVRRRISQMARESSLSSKVAQGCGLLRVDSASETVGVVSEVTAVEKRKETESNEQRKKT